MAASSSSAVASQLPKKYDVFISFRGEDTRFNFTSHLHDALRRNQIHTYIDYRLEKGDEVWPALEKAIEESTLFLVIFSEKYASSTWCLRELTKILEWTEDHRKEQLVIPVFYKVDPSAVRKQLGSYEKAFEEHEKKSNNNEQQLLQWRKALTETSNVSGWHCSVDRDEAELIGEIVKCVARKVDSMYRSKGNLENLIGIHEKIAEVESLLCKGSPQDVRFIGIWGMGGIGKTTLARAMYDKLHPQYEGCCFLDNVREKSKECGGKAALRKELISKLLGNKESHIGKHEEITSYHMRRLSRKRSLIVLDDVDDQEHLENLAGRRDWFGAGSTILITTRNKHVLSKEVDNLYEVEPLDCEEAFHLFSLHAFKNESAKQKLRGLAKDVIKYVQGIPLALKVLGSVLHGRRKREWESQLEKLKKMPHPKIHDVLKLSFEGLDHEEKSIFLDVACIFKGHSADYVKNLLDACGYSTTIGLKSLEDKALLYINEKIIYMHDLIQEMGREIVREESLKNPEKRSRLWNSNEIVQILKDGVGTKAIEAISLDLSEITEEMNLSPQAFCSMPNLRFLDFHTKLSEENRLYCPHDLDFLSNELRLLRWNRCPLQSLPATFKAESLVTIAMPYSNLTKLWDGDQNLVNLREINLHGSQNLIELPNFSRSIHLKHVELSYCSELRSVHPSILSHHSLNHLELRRCKALTSLTSDIHLKSLKLLDLAQCSSLRKFSVTSESCLFSLDLSETAINDDLSSSSGHLSKIDSLYLTDCDVTNLPYKLADLSHLRYLYMGGCHNLAMRLRFIFQGSSALKGLWVDDCQNLFELPDNINLLSSLQQLSLEMTDVETLPVSIRHLSNLKYLCLTNCKRLRSLPELPPSILRLQADNCTSLETLYLPLTTAIIKEEEEKEGEHEEKEDEDEDDEDDEDEDEEDDEDKDEDELSWSFDFRNCMKLDEQSIKVVEAKPLLLMNNGTYHFVELIYPGNKVPEWFMYRSTQSSVTVDVNSIPEPWDRSFIFCAVVSKLPSMATIHFECFFNDQKYYDFAHPILQINGSTFSDHICIWYAHDVLLPTNWKIKEKETNDESCTDHALVELKFKVRMHDDDGDEECSADDGTFGEIKECGVCPTSAPEFLNYIKQMQLALQPPPNSIDCSSHKEAVSQKRKYHSFIELDEMDSRKKQKLKGLLFPRDSAANGILENVMIFVSSASRLRCQSR